MASLCFSGTLTPCSKCSCAASELRKNLTRQNTKNLGTLIRTNLYARAHRSKRCLYYLASVSASSSSSARPDHSSVVAVYTLVILSSSFLPIQVSLIVFITNLSVFSCLFWFYQSECEVVWLPSSSPESPSQDKRTPDPVIQYYYIKFSSVPVLVYKICTLSERLKIFCHKYIIVHTALR